MFIQSVITVEFIPDLVGVMLRALHAKMKVVGQNPDIYEKFKSDELCTVQMVAAIIRPIHFLFFSYHVKAYLNSEIYCGKNSDIFS